MSKREAPVEEIVEVRPEIVPQGDVDIQIATARRFPRSITTFKQRATEMATLDVETAESCMYALPREGKTIEGPSARLAEIIACAYGNIRAEGRPVGDDGEFVTSRGTCWDIQNNVLIAFEVRRRITDKKGKRYSADMIATTANAATSIALRNATLKVVPKAFWGPVYDTCRKVAIGDASTLAARRLKMLEYFLKLGVTSEKVFALLEVKGIEDVTLEHMAKLTGLRTAIKEGEISVDEAFEPKEEATIQGPKRKSAAQPEAATQEQPNNVQS